MNSEMTSLLARHVDAENAHDMPATLATLHRDCVFHDVALDRKYLGHTGAATYYRLWWDAFRLEFRRDEGSLVHWTNEGRCVAEGMFAGVHVGPFLGIEPTGARINYRFAVVVDFREGLMAGERFYYDLDGIRRQIVRRHDARKA